MSISFVTFLSILQFNISNPHPILGIDMDDMLFSTICFFIASRLDLNVSCCLSKKYSFGSDYK